MLRNRSALVTRVKIMSKAINSFIFMHMYEYIIYEYIIYITCVEMFLLIFLSNKLERGI